MKTALLLLCLVGAAAVGGCTCASASWYPHDTFIGSSGWPSDQVPLDHVDPLEP